MKIEIKSYEDQYWESLRDFINKEWKENHPITNKELFYWQYRGGINDISCSKLVLIDDRIVGFLGAIPNKYLLDGKVVKGVALAVWIISKQFRNTGLGIYLLDKVEQENDCIVCLGINANVVKFYQLRDYKYLDKLNRYVLPLDIRKFCELTGSYETQNHKILSLNDTKLTKPTTFDPELAEKLWTEFVRRYDFKLTLHKDKNYWQWRYIDSVGFDYLFFADSERIIIGRIEEIKGDTPLEGDKVFRIIEIITSDDAERDIIFLKSVLNFAKVSGAILADFQISTDVLGKLLTSAGFRERKEDKHLTSVPEVFAPLNSRVNPINLAIKCSNNDKVSFDQTYFVKSDGDMDRPVEL